MLLGLATLLAQNVWNHNDFYFKFVISGDGFSFLNFVSNFVGVSYSPNDFTHSM